MLRLRSERGDTIIEVLVVLTILASAFAISYATANKSLITSRESQEHSEALQYLSEQLELLRSGAQQAGTNVFTGPGSFCMSGSPTMPVLFASSYDASAVTATNDDFTKYPNPECVKGDQNLYHLSITYVPIPPGNPGAFDIFTLYVRWDGPSTNGRQQESLTYKMHP